MGQLGAAWGPGPRAGRHCPWGSSLRELHCERLCMLRICGCTCALAGGARNAARQQHERSNSSGECGAAACRAAQDRGGLCRLRSACAICNYVRGGVCLSNSTYVIREKMFPMGGVSVRAAGMAVWEGALGWAAARARGPWSVARGTLRQPGRAFA